MSRVARPGAASARSASALWCIIGLAVAVEDEHVKVKHVKHVKVKHVKHVKVKHVKHV